MPPLEPETAQAPKGTSKSVFVDPSFDSTPGTPGTHTAHGLPPTINRIRRGMHGEASNDGQLKKLMVANRGVSTAVQVHHLDVLLMSFFFIP